ncbi:hypothetical protein N7517_001791 [Penicillium concentricum]|uniref:Uncharacterized protein n=1 Tax=Penicillium concentricum TaxID=293559 RepID=A0A9W9STJ5_9EURO|nr:uncharacterized protein N7517_001791 [Penicillium concentricum]KAJ5383880.1 hypothetical protein N7517_001791 [Penicillium concentricum]
MDDLCCAHDFDLKTRERIEIHLLRSAEGSFLWVGFVVNEMMTLETHTEILDTMKRIPRGLPEMYSRILAQIKQKHQKFVPIVVTLLHWLAVSTKSLSPSELLAVLAHDKIVIGLKTIQDLIKICGGFLQIYSNDKYGRSGNVTLVHQSAKEYLATNSDPELEEFWFAEDLAHFYIANRCLERLESIPDLGYRATNLLSDSSRWTMSLFLGYFPGRHPKNFSSTIQNFPPDQAELAKVNFYLPYSRNHWETLFRGRANIVQVNRNANLQANPNIANLLLDAGADENGDDQGKTVHLLTMCWHKGMKICCALKISTLRETIRASAGQSW